MSLTQVLLIVVFGYAGLRSSRNIPLFAIIAAPILAGHVWHIFKERGWTRMLAIEIPSSRLMVTVNWLLLVVIALVGLVRIGTVISNQSTVERAKFPAAAVDFLQAQKMYAPLYNSYDWGGYLIWQLYPQSRVFIDGRADVHGDQFIENVYLKAYHGGASWREPLDQYGVRVVLVEPFAPIAAQLAKDSAWSKVYENKQAVVYTR